MPWGMKVNVPLHPKANCGKERATSLYNEGHSDQRASEHGARRRENHYKRIFKIRLLCETDLHRQDDREKISEIVVFRFKGGICVGVNEDETAFSRSVRGAFRTRSGEHRGVRIGLACAC